MYNHKKLKSSFFLRDDFYPERILSKHKYYKKSKLYVFVRSQLLPVSNSISGSSDASVVKDSKMLLQNISQLYLYNSLDKQNKAWQKETRANILTSKATTPQVLPMAKHVSEKENVGLNKNKVLVNRGLQEIESSAFTNGLLESGHRYFRI